ncbi:MAG: tRNA pseudouridine(55) synthase TruB [Candidatus Eremiobacteraeota bacterium]|nr:tRNA pseudouridine(55) synthase TruB [Candidatus Eremiobacteraeota bacterium]
MIGFVNLFKAAGPTSAQALARVRRIYCVYADDRRLSAGHLGTLDPQASGVLPVAVGKATRLIPLLTDQRKSYAFTLVVGRSTATHDAHGETLESAAVPVDWSHRLERALGRFIGRISQTPPMYSAAHHRGRRLYDLAREGQCVEPKPRTITIYGLRLLGIEHPSIARLRLACSEGTYVRSLCRDLGAAIGVPAHMGALVREASGQFVASEALTLDEIAHDPHRALVAPEHVLALPTIVLTLRESSDFRAGRIVPLPQGATARHVFVRDETRALVGIGEARGALLAPRKVFS